GPCLPLPFRRERVRVPSERKPTGPTRRSVKNPPSARSATGAPTQVSRQRPGGTPSGKKATNGAGSARGNGKKSFWNYPRRGKGPVTRWLPSWRFLLVSALALFALGAGVFFYFYATTDVPEAQDIALAESSTVYFADGETQMGSFAEVNRDII